MTPCSNEIAAPGEYARLVFWNRTDLTPSFSAALPISSLPMRLSASITGVKNTLVHTSGYLMLLPEYVSCAHSTVTGSGNPAAWSILLTRSLNWLDLKSSIARRSARPMTTPLVRLCPDNATPAAKSRYNRRHVHAVRVPGRRAALRRRPAPGDRRRGRHAV